MDLRRPLVYLLTVAVARLMYACGDVPDPDPQSVEYMEDLVVEFIGDLVGSQGLVGDEC